MPLQFFIFFLLTVAATVSAQIDSTLIPISTDDSSPVGKDGCNWACIANFTLSDEKNHGRIKFVDTDNKGNVFVVDNNGYLYAFDGKDFSEKWKVKLYYEHINKMEVSPNGETLAICYNYIKASTKKLEVRNAINGRIILKIKRVPRCYDESYFVDVAENTTLYPYNIAYSPDGTKLAVWFKNHGFDENQCKATFEEQFIIMSPTRGDVFASKNELPKDFYWERCDADFPFVFSADGKYVYVANCKAQVAKYDVEDLDLVMVDNFGERIHTILTEQFGEKGSKKSNFPFHELAVQKDGSILTSVGKEGRIFKIKPDLSEIYYVTQNQGTIDGHFSFSPDWTMAMFNANHINLWDLKSKKPVLYTETPAAFDANTVRFHPKKRALIVGTKRTIKILALLPSSKMHLSDTFKSTGHFLNPETSFSVRGKGKISWAYDDKIMFHKYAKDDEIVTEILGYSSLFNSQQNLPKPSELRLKTDNPGFYTIFGGTTKPMTDKEALQSLDNW